MTTTPATPTTNDPSLEALTKYTWEPQPKAAAFVKKVVDDFLEKLPEARTFAERLYRETGNRFGDLVDEITFSDPAWLVQAEDAGWREVERQTVDPDSDHELRLLLNPAGMFPAVSDSYHMSEEVRISLKVESVTDFIAALGPQPERPHIFGRPLYSRRTEIVWRSEEMVLAVQERHGRGHGWSDLGPDEPSADAVLQVQESFRLRPRRFDDEGRGFGETLDLVNKAIRAVGRDRACDLFFAAEREYWQRRNTAAQFQKARQDRLGIGWANHDHHTYRSSRRHFHRLVALWEKLGFECRERFYPGPEAGWGAQVMEQPVCGIVTFNDVDISPDELLMDFAHEPMQERNSLGTVGLWCALHGESVLQAGMHHLECTFDFDALEQQMASEGGIKTMKKFTDFPYLKQAFTQGERWKVDPERVHRLKADGFISEEQAQAFIENGAIGSHLENLERNDGFKGFNQTGVTEIIHATDPRKQRGE